MTQSLTERQQQLEEERLDRLHFMVKDWTMKVCQSILRFENLKRRDAKRPLLPKSAYVFIPQGQTRICLLNWKVWSMRYCVSLDFIVEAVFTRMDYVRKKRGTDNVIQLGASASSLTGEKAKEALLEAISVQFPNGENRKSAHQQLPPPPIPFLKYDTMDEMVERYDHIMTQRQREFRKEPPKYKRNFRKL